MSETELALGVVDVQADGVAVRHDHPAGIVAQQRADRVTITAQRDLKRVQVFWSDYVDVGIAPRA